MPPLINQLRSFLSWLKEHALPGFKDQAEDYFDTEGTYEIAFDVLVSLGSDMKTAVERGDQQNFNSFKDQYLRLFDKINEFIAKQMFEAARDKYLGQNHSSLDADTYAIEEVWQNPAARYYLKAHVLIKHQDGREVFLIANERHIPRDNLYVITTELEHLRASSIDPWEHVATRKAQ